MKIELEVSDENEATAEPWWMIVDPQQNFGIGSEAVSRIAIGMITGPFFSRAEAQAELTNRRYDYGKGAAVWCSSGCNTVAYRNACRAAERKAKRIKQTVEDAKGQVTTKDVTDG